MERNKKDYAAMASVFFTVAEREDRKAMYDAWAKPHNYSGAEREDLLGTIVEIDGPPQAAFEYNPTPELPGNVRFTYVKLAFAGKDPVKLALYANDILSNCRSRLKDFPGSVWFWRQRPSMVQNLEEFDFDVETPNTPNPNYGMFYWRCRFATWPGLPNHLLGQYVTPEGAHAKVVC